MREVCKLLNMNLQIHWKVTKIFTVDAEFNLYTKAYVIYRVNRFLKLEKERKNTFISIPCTTEGCIKVIKYEFRKALQLEESITSRCRI